MVGCGRTAHRSSFVPVLSRIPAARIGSLVALSVTVPEIPPSFSSASLVQLHNSATATIK